MNKINQKDTLRNIEYHSIQNTLEKSETLVYITKKEFYNKLKNIKKYNEIKKLESLYFQHGTTTVYKHSRNVAYYSMLIAKKLEEKFNIKFNYNNLIIGAFLHDLFLYDWHEKDASHRLHGYRHPHTASVNAKNMCNVNEDVVKIIKSHMWPLTIRKIPSTREAIIVCFVDKLVAMNETIQFIRFFNKIKTAFVVR